MSMEFISVTVRIVLPMLYLTVNGQTDVCMPLKVYIYIFIFHICVWHSSLRMYPLNPFAICEISLNTCTNPCLRLFWWYANDRICAEKLSFVRLHAFIKSVLFVCGIRPQNFFLFFSSFYQCFEYVCTSLWPPRCACISFHGQIDLRIPKSLSLYACLHVLISLVRLWYQYVFK